MTEAPPTNQTAATRLIRVVSLSGRSVQEKRALQADLIKAAKAGDKPGQQQADTRWQQNAVQIAEFLSKANPHWPKDTFADLMNKHWEADVRAFHEVYEHILHMSDALSDGTAKQFPNKFA